LDIYMDESIIEVFVNDGEQVMTHQIFPIKRALMVKLNAL